MKHRAGFAGVGDAGHHPLKMRVPIEAALVRGGLLEFGVHHPLKMRVPIEANMDPGAPVRPVDLHHPLKMRVPIEATPERKTFSRAVCASPSENEGPY